MAQDSLDNFGAYRKANDLIISRASARETRGRYRRMEHWLESSVIEDRDNRYDDIIGILTKVINRMKDG